MNRIRAPWETERDEAQREIYSETQFSAIEATFEQKPDFAQARFRQSIGRCAALYLEAKRLLSTIATPSERRGDLRRLSANLQKFMVSLDEARADPYTNRLLSNAAGHDHHGTAEPGDPLQRLIGRLDWLRQVIERATTDATPREKPKGGNRADAALYELILSLAEVYEREAITPRRPSGWSADSDADEFLKFLQAVLRPIGVKKTDLALRENYRDASRAIGA